MSGRAYRLSLQARGDDVDSQTLQSDALPVEKSAHSNELVCWDPRWPAGRPRVRGERTLSQSRSGRPTSYGAVTANVTARGGVSKKDT